MGAIRLACLLPARNCTGYLPGYFESVARVADAVVALDDGSTDETRALLSSQPLVKILLTNPVRASYEGWDDGANRNRLLDAVGELEPEWVLSLDADERLDPSDAEAMMEFLENKAIPGEGYLLQIYRMVDDLAHYDLHGLWVGRLFAWERGLRFPPDRLHGGALPISIPPSRCRRTTLRIQHLGDLDRSRRRERFAKYLEADLKCEYQRSYLNLLVPPRRLWPWWVRSSHLPILANSADSNPPKAEPGTPAISVVVSCVGPGQCIRAVCAAIAQHCTDPTEIIVVTDDETVASRVREIASSVRIVDVPGGSSPSRARNLGLEAANGTYVWFIDNNAELSDGALEGILKVHRSGYAMVRGAVLNGTQTAAGWASYLLDHLEDLAGSTSRELSEPPRDCSYLRTALEETGGFPEDVDSECEVLVNTILFRRGYGAFSAQQVRVTRYCDSINPWTLATGQFRAGRVIGRRIVEHSRIQAQVGTPWMAGFMVASIPRRIGAVGSVVLSRRDALPPVRRLGPIVILGVLAYWAGGCFEVALRVPTLTVEVRRLQRITHEARDGALRHDQS